MPVMPIKHELLTAIIEFLRPLPDFQDEPSRRTLLLKAGIDLSKFNLNESPKNFLPALLHDLNNSGFEEKIVTILQKIDVGGKLREKADNFIQRLQQWQPDETNSATSLSSSGEMMQAENTSSNMAKKRILIFATCPKDQAPLRLDEEIRTIKESINSSTFRDDFEVEQEGAVRRRDIIRTLLNNGNFQIIHFSGHGNEHSIFIENEKGDTDLLNPEGLSELFKSLEHLPECVLLNICNSEKSADILGKTIPYVIGMNFPIGDSAAIKFSAGFYSALGAGRSYRDAFVIGKAAIQMTDSSEYLYPVFKENNVRPENPSEDISFVNRKKELSDFSTIPYLIIDAPSQYGKTELLKKLQSQSKSDDKYCFYIELPNESGKNDVLCQILRKLQKCQNKPEMICNEKPCLQKNVLSKISTYLLSNMKAAAKKRISLYIDRADRLPDSDVKELFDHTLLELYEQINTINRISFQVIIAGRDISRWKEKIKELPFEVRFLSPFDFNAVKEMVVLYDAQKRINFLPEYQRDFAALLLYLTGGHPGLMLFILEQYYQQSTTRILQHEQELYHRQQFTTLFRELGGEIIALPFRDLSIFRRYTIELLQKIIAAKMIPFHGEAEDLEKQLRFSRLVNQTDDGFIQDGIVRRVFAIQLRHENGDAAFATLCQRAKEIYKAHLLEFAHAPHIVATEILFEEILRLYYSSAQKSNSSERYKAFFSKEGELENCLQILLHKVTIGDYIINQFHQMLKAEQDWEFKFTVNFFLRQTDDYTDEPYQRLLEYIECFIREHKLS